jgi:conjugative transfer signal peptidase TraF
MTALINTTQRQTSQRRRAIMLLAVAAGFVLSMFATAHFGNFRINLTPSEPLGLWRVVRLDRPAAVGDLVFICPPPAEATMVQAKQRGYLRAGLCPGDYAPLIKTVIATAGQYVEISTVVSVDGRVIAHSEIAKRDGKGRRLHPFPSGTVPAGSVFLHSGYPGSYDSRYFGPIPQSGMLGLAQEVMTYAP